jgi:predicted DNA-binding protein
MMNTLIGCRIPRPLADRLNQLASATARPRSQIVRYFLSRACTEALPDSWFETVDTQRLVTGRGNGGAEREP